MDEGGRTTIQDLLSECQPGIDRIAGPKERSMHELSNPQFGVRSTMVGFSATANPGSHFQIGEREVMLIQNEVDEYTPHVVHQDPNRGWNWVPVGAQPDPTGDENYN